MSTKARYAVGIDLGTTNCVIAAIDLEKNTGAYPEILTIPIHQRLDEEMIGSSDKLPSFLFYPTDAQREQLDPFRDNEDEWVVGEAAAAMGRRIRGRLVTSAKSWLCHTRIDHHSQILPWGGVDDIPKMSPVEATRRILEHIKYGWETSEIGRNHALEDQFVTVTLPASFDQGARQLTHLACEQAGLGEVRLLEEPQAAFYNWISLRRGRWDEALGSSRRVLICDVGGGTSDFSLVECVKDDEDFEFSRLAVGSHLLLGGDNMDLALANLAESRISDGKKSLNQSRWQLLAQLTRNAKERLLQEGGEDEVTIRLPGMGTKVIGGLRQTNLLREDIEKLILDGFYPQIDFSYEPQISAGLSEMGLPYENEPAITWHILNFLKEHESVGEQFPDAILFNGGSLEPPVIRQRIVDVLQSNSPNGDAIRILESDSLAEAVARGAAFYSYTHERGGLKIGGGSPHAYYLGIHSGKDIHPVCMVPKGTQAHEPVRLNLEGLEVLTNHPVSFPLYHSDRFPLDEVGHKHDGTESMHAVGHLNAMVRFGKSESRTIPVELSGELTELDTLNIELDSLNTPHKWKLEFDLRTKQEEGEAVEAEEALAFEGLTEQLKSSLDQNPQKGLIKLIETHYETSRRDWNIASLRKIADALFELETVTKKSPQHEATWLNACSYAMRPGFGEARDEMRMKKVWSLFRAGPRSGKDTRARSEWAILWRRIAPGLEAGRQFDLFQRQKRELSDKKGLPRLSGEYVEFWRMLASMEQLAANDKAYLGDLLFKHIQKDSVKNLEMSLWALSRLGTRQPLLGNMEGVLAPEIVSPWIEFLIKDPKFLGQGSLQTLIECSRLSGMRDQDIDERLRMKVIDYISAHAELEDDKWRQPLEIVQQREVFEQNCLIGESLPIGLVLKQD